MIPQHVIDDVRARHRISDAVRRRTKLTRAGGEWKGLCPFHDERTPSFFVNDVKGFAHCFGCGWNGDIIRFVEESERVSFRDAVVMLAGGGLPDIDPAEFTRAKAEDAKAKADAIAEAERFWNEGGSIAGTPADAYLLSRRIVVRPDALRFGMVPSWRNPDTGCWNARKPCLLIRAEDLAGAFVGIQRIFLSGDGRKADMAQPKLSLGRVRGASIRFGHVRREAIVTGGPEDGLTLFQKHAELATVYVACGESNLPFIALPRFTRTVTVAMQNDEPGQMNGRKAAAAFREQRRRVFETAPPPRFKDWNDELCEKATL